MDLKTQFQLRSTPYLINYLQTHSYWYKYLNRDPESIVIMDKEAKEFYKLTAKDKIQNIGSKIELIRNFMEILR